MGDEEKIRKWERYLEHNPSSKVFAPLAEAYRKRGLLDKALRIASEGVRRNPEYIGGRVALARVYVDKGMVDEARKELRYILERSPDTLSASRLLRELDGMEGGGDRRGNPFCNLTFAAILEGQKCYKEAEKIYRAILAKDPGKRDIVLRRLERLKDRISREGSVEL